MIAHHGKPRRPPLSAGIDAHREQRRTASCDRAVFDILRRLRDAREDPPHLEDAYGALMNLRGKSLDLDELRAAAIELTVAAAAIVSHLPPPDLNLDDSDVT